MYKLLLTAFAITTASAEAAPLAGGFDIMSLMPFALIFVVFYFLLLRPQQKKMKSHKDLLANLKRGDRVITSGGLIGQVDRIINDQEVSLEIADGVKARFAKQMITDIMVKGSPVAASKPAQKKTIEKKSPTKKTTTKKPAKK